MIENRLEAARLACSPQASPSTGSWPTSTATPPVRLPIEPNARRLTLSTDATLFAVGAETRLLYDNGHRGLWPDDIDDWTPSELLLARRG